MGYTDSRLATLVSEGLHSSRRIEHFLVRTPSEREAIYRLRYEAYHEVGHVGEMEAGSLSDEYDHKGSPSIFGITLDGNLVSTIRLGRINKKQRSSITYEVFKDHLEPLIQGGETIAHGSRLAVRCSNSAARRAVILYTLSLASAFSASVQADRGAMIVREGHVQFYKRYGFDRISGPRSYHETRTPLSLMMINLSKPDRIRCAPSHAGRSDHVRHALVTM